MSSPSSMYTFFGACRVLARLQLRSVVFHRLVIHRLVIHSVLALLGCVSAAAQAGFRTEVVASGLKEPVALAVFAEGGEERILVAERAGALKLVDVKSGKAAQVAKLGEDVPGERIEVLDVVLHPQFTKNREAFISYHLNIDNESCFFNLVMLGIAEAVSAATPKLGRELLREAIPCGPANGGGLSFTGSDHLFVGVGTGKEMLGKKISQSRNSLLGKILRIAVDKDFPYGVPDDNPYLDSANEDARAIWAVGFRDPYRIAYSAASKKLAVIDRGTGLYEELNYVVAKGNFGWPMFEGAECQMLRFDCLGERFGNPEFTLSGKGVLTGLALLESGSGPLSGKAVLAKVSPGTVYGIPLPANKGKRVQVKLGGRIDSISAAPSGGLYLVDSSKGLVQKLR